MRKLLSLAVLLVLSFLLGDSALAQKRAVVKPITETIDFTGYGGSGNPGISISWNNNRNPVINNQVVSTRLSVANTNDWQLYGSNTFNETYLQKRTSNSSYVSISGMKEGDVVTVWGESGDNNGGCRVTSGNAEPSEDMTFDASNPSRTFTMTGSGTLTLQFYNSYSGLRKISIQSMVRETPHFDYDPGYEEYDMYDEFSQNDPDKSYNNNGQQTGSSYHTSYTLSTEETGITLNGKAAKYIILSGSKNTANNRIAIDPNAGDWRFNYGLRSPSGTWGTFSICNLREGDRVVFSYTGTPPVFSSNGQNGSYDGSKAFFDKYNDGTFDEGEDVYIASGANPVTDWYRGEGNIYAEDNNGRYDDSPDVNPLRYTRYVITEDGHLDLAIAPDTRIVKIKIYSDHQASMVDEYDAEKYTAKFDITGELQAMEHIVPGGLEVHVGNNDASQHAHVVSSPQGPVSIVNGVNGYKLPGMSLDANGNLQFEFNLANNIPETGTFYKFMPLEDGKMTLTFQAASMNYYSYGIDGDAVYYGTNWSYDTSEQGNIWTEQFDRPNEQTRGVTCPYYLVKVDARGNKTFTKIGDYFNGEEVTYEIPGDVKAEETYYLYGGWNATGLRFNGSGQGRNNLEYLPYGAGNGGENKACGVAKLLEVVFNPKKKIYPLAKWVPNDTRAVNNDNPVPNPDTFASEYELADLWGYTDKTSLTVKKMSGNITACHPYLVPANAQGEHNHYKLVIDGITFDGSGDKGGTILIKIGDARIKGNPVYALTIAYSADPTFDGNSGTGTRGHIWDYSSNALNGLKYDQSNVHVESHIHPGNIPVYTHNAATPEPYGHYFKNYFDADISQYSSNDEVLEALPKSGTGLLYEEISGGTSDWMFNYNLVNAGKLYDPMFTNKYDLEGDNADLIWETEGMVLRTSANSSVMFNEFTGADIHQSTEDPERYVGILKGGEFRIPWLRPNDRVIIYMGTGKGAFNDQAVFNIRGAYDAVHNEINESDDYVIGGSHWDGEKGDNNYRGCYHFFAKGQRDAEGKPVLDENGKPKPADMVFKMTGGSMCKIYSIQIYRGDRIITNEIVGKAENDKFLLWSTAKDPNDADDEARTGSTSNWALKYLGRNQQLANGTGKFSQTNEIVAQTGKFNSPTPTLTVNSQDGGDQVESFTYEHQPGEIGTFRMRGKDMEKGMNYVADYADHNVTIAYQETQTYPYTWDFTDVTGIEANVKNLFEPEEQLGEEETAPEGSGISQVDWVAAAQSYQRTARDLSLWEVNSTNGNYFLRLNSQSSQTPQKPMIEDNIFETAKEIGGNQVWANGTVVPEMQGLWFYTDNNNQKNGEWDLIKGDANNSGGLEFDGSDPYFKKMVIPNVPANAAVYLRMTKVTNNPVKIKYWLGDGDFSLIEDDDFSEIEDGEVMRFYEVGTTGDYILALLNNRTSKSNLILALNGYRIQKLAVSEDFKKVNKYGWATESRARVIDPSLTSELTSINIKHYIVTGASHADLKVTFTEIGNGVYMPKAEEDGNQAYIIRNMDTQDYLLDDQGNQIMENGEPKKNPERGLVKILKVDGAWGFHLFVPDMNDWLESRPDGDYRHNLKHAQPVEDNMLLARLDGDLVQKGGDDIYNYVMTTSTTSSSSGKVNEYDDIVFARVSPKGMKGGKNVGYLPVDCSDGNNGNAKMMIVFAPFVEPEPIADAVEVSFNEATGVSGSNAVYYNLNGQKMDGRPTEGGIYIVNGKKVVVK